MFKTPFDMPHAEIIFSDASDLAAGVYYNGSWTVVPFSEEHSWMAKQFSGENCLP